MKKGFTLIELLAVLIIISILSLMTTVVVTGIIKNAKKEAFKNTTYGLVSAGKIYYTEQLLSGDLPSVKIFEIQDGIWNSDALSIKGQLPKDGKIAVNVDGRISMAIFNGNYCAIKGFDSNEIEIFDDKSKDECLKQIELKIRYKEKILNGADPELSTGMIPININEKGIVTVADLYNKWYEYNKSQWANAVLVDSTTRDTILDGNTIKESAIGTVIAELNILAYLVWIPRYAYTGLIADPTYTPISYNPVYEEKAKEIGILFQDASTKTSDTHPAFTFGTEEVNGFWVGKFESGFNQGGVCGKIAEYPNFWITEIAEGTNTTTKDSCTGNGTLGEEANKADVNRLLIKPSIPSWRGINIKKMYNISLSLSSSSKFGLTVNDTDSHMMKNMEWGAVAYLSHSKYGAIKDMNINNCSNYITGTGASGPNEPESTKTCKNVLHDWKSENGMGASTTGNITGIYDMSGGSWEYVMGYSKYGGEEGGESGFTKEDMLKFVNYSTNEYGVDSKYIDLYDYEINPIPESNTNFSRGKRGDATVELGPFKTTEYLSNGVFSVRNSWYGSCAQFTRSNEPWNIRGYFYLSSFCSGIFSSHRSEGKEKKLYSFRVVVTPVAR